MAKIAKVDAAAMDSLYSAEVSRMGVKTAAGIGDQNGAPKDPQAFKDHEDYLATLEAVMKEDAKTDFQPNDVTLD